MKFDNETILRWKQQAEMNMNMTDKDRERMEYLQYTDFKIKDGGIFVGCFDGSTNENKIDKTVDDIFVGAEAWIIAHRCGITNEAYTDRDVVDAHIKTALQKIFPNAVFKDKYSY